MDLLSGHLGPFILSRVSGYFWVCIEASVLFQNQWRRLHIHLIVVGDSFLMYLFMSLVILSSPSFYLSGLDGVIHCMYLSFVMILVYLLSTWAFTSGFSQVLSFPYFVGSGRKAQPRILSTRSSANSHLTKGKHVDGLLLHAYQLIGFKPISIEFGSCQIQLLN